MISIFPADATDFSTNGLCVLAPSSCLVNETLNGEWELNLAHPLDEQGKWTWLQVGYIIKAPVPASMTPRVNLLQTSEGRSIYRITTSGGNLNLWSKPTRSSSSLAQYKNGREVQVLNTTNPDFYEAIAPDGKRGYMASEYLVFVRTEASNVTATTQVVESRQLREQPFRIYRIVPELTQVTVYARHIFYDLLDNMIYEYKPAQGTAGSVALGEILEACQTAHNFSGFSNITKTIDEMDLQNTNPVEAVLGEEGLLDKTSGELARDWFDIFAVTRVGRDTDIQIRQGKNLLGISYDVNDTNVVTRIVPTGETKDGELLYLDEKYVDSPHIAEYPRPRWIHLPVSEAKVSDDMTLAQAKAKLLQAAQDEFENGCDLPDISIDVEFINLADTAEYAQYRPLSDIFLGDSVQVVVPTLGLEVSMRMTEYSYDCLLKRYAKMTLGMAVETASTISSRQLPAGGIKGIKLSMGSIGSGHINTLSANKITTGTLDASLINVTNLNASNITTGTLDASQVNAINLNAGNITTGTLSANQIGANQITATHIGANQIITNSANIANAVINTAHIGTLDASAITTGTLDAQTIDVVNLNADNIVSGSIDAEVIDVVNLNADNITAGHLDAGIIAAGSITANHIGTNEIIANSANIADGVITNAMIAAAGIDYANITDLNAGTTIFRTGVGDALYLDRLVVNSANIGTATIGELLVRDDQGNLHRIEIGTDGVVSSTAVQIDGQNLSDDAMMQVSQRLIWRQATEPSSPFIGMIWMDTSPTPSGEPREILKRCTAITPSVVWEVVQSNELHTNVIDVDDNGMNILSGGNLNLLSGGAINIKNLSGTANVINMDNTGLTLSSTGQLKLQSTDSIIIGGSPFSVGGTNLLTGTSGEYTSFTLSNAYLRVVGTAILADIGVVVGGQVSAGLYINNTLSVGVRIRVTFYNADYSIQYGTQYGNTIAAGTSGFSKVENYTVPASTLRIRVLFSTDGSVNTTGTAEYKWAKLEKGPIATDWSPSPQDTVDALAGIGTQITGLQTQVDGKIDTYFGSNDPSSGWTSAQKAAAVGDMWYNSTARKLKRWNGTSWDDINDQTAIDAYDAASTAQDTADGKRRVFTDTPVPPYDIGDLWAGGSTEDLKRCSKAKAAGGSYAAGDWVLATKYTDDTVASAAAAAASAAQGAADTAASNASTALSQLSDLSADSKLTPVEKKAAKKEWDVIAGEKSRIDAEADEYGVSKTAYGTAYTSLDTYLNGASGLLLNLNTTSNITATTFRAKFTNYYNARQDVLNAITSKAKQLADNAQGAITGFLTNTLPGLQARVQVFYQTTKPTYTAVGDLWYDTNSNPLEVWKCTDVSSQPQAHTAFTDPVLTRALTAAAAAQTTANSKITTFVQSTTPTALAPGDLWLDTGNNNIWKRATAAGTGGWVQYLTAAGYLITTGITIDGANLTVKANGNLNLAADGNLNVQNGGNLNVLNGGDIEISLGGDINVASGGRINLTTANDLMLGGQNITAFADGRISAAADTIDLSANNSIKLAVSGGTNLIPNSDFAQGLWSTWQVTAAYSNEYRGKSSMLLTVASDKANGFAAGSTVPYDGVGGLTVSGSILTYISSSFSPSNYADGNTVFQLRYYDSSDVQLGTHAMTAGEVRAHPNFVSGTFSRVSKSFGAPPVGTARVRLYLYCYKASNTIRYAEVQVEKGTMATDWSPAPSDPASGVKTSSVVVDTTGISMDTTGNFNVAAGGKINVSATDLMISGQTVETYAGEKITLSVGQYGRAVGADLLAGATYEDGYLNTAGEPVSLSTWHRSDYISVFPGEVYAYMGTNSLAHASAGLVFYDQDKTFVSGTDAVSRGFFTIPRTCYYVRYSKIKTHTGRVEKVSRTSGDNLIVGIESGKYMTSTGSTSSNVGWSITNYIPIFAGERYKAKGQATVGIAPATAFFTIEKSFISAITGAERLSFTAPANAAFVRHSIFNTDLPTARLEKTASASDLKTSSVAVTDSGIYMDTTGEISMNSGTSLKMNSGTVQIEAGDASDSHLQFGDAFSVGKDSTGDYALAINSRSDDAIKVNGKSIWHKGNIVVQQTQPASGKQTVWLKPNATTGVSYKRTITATNGNWYTSPSGKVTHNLTAASPDTISVAGTYNFSVTMTFKRFGGTGIATYNTSGGTVKLIKGGQTLTLSALPSMALKPWASQSVTVTGSSTNPIFTSSTTDIVCEVTVSGAKAYDNNDFLSHGRPSDITCNIIGPGGASAQACQVFYVP